MTETTNPTSAGIMQAAFPVSCAPINGKPNCREFIRVLKHLMQCAQTQHTDISSCKLLFLCLGPDLYAYYTQEAYPDMPEDPGSMCLHGPADNASQRANAKARWDLLYKRYNDCITMISCLKQRFLSLISEDYKRDYEKYMIGHANDTFIDCFAWFTNKYGKTTELERKANKDTLEEDWTLQDGWEALERRTEDALLYAECASRPISDADAIDAVMLAIQKTGLFAAGYEEWNALDDADSSTWQQFKDFWSAKCALKQTSTTAAGQFGYGMNAAAGQAGGDETYDQSVLNFSNAHNNTTATINNLTAANSQMQATLPAIQQQLQQLQMQMAYNQQANMMQQQAAPPSWQQQNNSNNRNRSRGKKGKKKEWKQTASR